MPPLIGLGVTANRTQVLAEINSRRLSDDRCCASITHDEPNRDFMIER